MPFVGSMAASVVMYAWSRREPDTPMNIYGFIVKGLHLPWAFMAIHVLMGASPIPDLIGIAIGHTYYFLVSEMPSRFGIKILSTPHFLRNYFDQNYSNVHFVGGGRGVTQGAAPGGNAPGAPPGPGGAGGAGAGLRQRTWGSGNVLGTR